MPGRTTLRGYGLGVSEGAQLLIARSNLHRVPPLAVDRGASRTTSQRVPDEIGQRRSREDARVLPRPPQKLTAALGDRRRLFGRCAALLRSRGGGCRVTGEGSGGGRRFRLDSVTRPP